MSLDIKDFGSFICVVSEVATIENRAGKFLPSHCTDANLFVATERGFNKV